jgi:FkbM family methyltransferase
MSLLRLAGHKLRTFVLPLVGFWEVFGRLEELRGRVGGLESANNASLGLLTDIKEQISQVDVGLKVASVASDELSAQVRERIVQIEADLTWRFDNLIAQIESDLARRFDRLAETFVTTVASETDRLDGYIAYHVDALKEDIVSLRDGVDTLRDGVDTLRDGIGTRNNPKLALVARPTEADTTGGLDALLLTTGYDLLVPIEEAGLIAYLLRHGPEAVEPGVRNVLQHRLKPGATVVDAGANIGIHSVAMALAVGPQGRVLCFEPLPHLAKAVGRTLRLNGLGDRTHVQQMALADKSGEATFYRAAHGPMSSLYSLPDGLSADAVSVRTTTLDECFAPGERVDFVKMDVEGAEPLVWRGMQRVLRENAAIEIILEWSPSHFQRAGENPVAFMAEICAAGFNPFVISDDGPVRLVPLHNGLDVLEASNLLLTRRSIRQDAV